MSGSLLEWVVFTKGGPGVTTIDTMERVRSTYFGRSPRYEAEDVGKVIMMEINQVLELPEHNQMIMRIN